MSQLGKIAQLKYNEEHRGTAWMITPKYALTACHCVRLDDGIILDSLSLVFPGLDSSVPIKVLEAVIELDTALIEVIESTIDLSDWVICLSCITCQKEEIIDAIGYPLEELGYHKHGFGITATVRDPQAQYSFVKDGVSCKVIQLYNVSVSPDDGSTNLHGMSGSPIFLRNNGNIAVGLLTKEIMSGSNLIGVPISTIASNKRLAIVSEALRKSSCFFGYSNDPPSWVDNWGRDEYGDWVEFSIQKNTKGESVIQKMRWIVPGKFMMGSPEMESERLDKEGPQHEVTIQKGYWLFDTACTQALWYAVLGKNPSCVKNEWNPVENVSWLDVQCFIRTLNQMLPGLELSLPSEAQWEYACRAGRLTPFSFGFNITPDQVNYDGNYPYKGDIKGQYRKQTVPVKSLPPNAWGLYEMHGNVCEWVLDVWHDTYEDAPKDGSAWDTGSTTSYRVLRGGSWHDCAKDCRSAYRVSNQEGCHKNANGFRCAGVQTCELGKQ